MKKILFIHHWSTVGGSGISLYNTWKSLESKFEIVSYIPDKPSDLFEFLKSKNLVAKTYSFTCGQIPYYSGGSNFYKPGFWYLILNAIKQISYWKKIIKLEAPDIIMVNSKVLCWMAPLFKGKKSVCFVRETIKGSPQNLLNKIMNRFLEKFSLVSFLSEYDLTQTNLKNPLTVVSPDILDPEEYIDIYGKKEACSLLKVDSNTFNIAFVGGLDQLKGIDVAIKAMKYLRNEKISLIVAGMDVSSKPNNIKNVFKRMTIRKSVKFAKKVKEYIEDNNLESLIKFVGVQTDISLVYSASEVLVFPMKKPHQSRPAFEIGIQCKPVIISDFKNIREFIKDGENGLVFEPNNPEKLANAILALKSNSSLLERMGKFNYSYSMQFHTEKYAISELLDAIHKMLNEENLYV